MMSKSIWGVAAAGLILSSLSFSQAHAGGDVDQASPLTDYYLSLQAGVNLPTGDVDFRNSAGTRVDTDFNPGVHIGGAIGAKWGNISLGSLVPRTELEISYTQNGVDSIDFSGNGPGNENVASGSISSSINVLGNLLFDFENSSPFTPYFGGGLGVAVTNLDLVYGGAPNLNDESVSFAWQVIGGLKYDLSERFSIFADARFRQLVDVNSERRLGANAIAGANGGNFEDDFNSVIMSAGVSVRF